MKIDKLTLRNFRGFEDLTFKFHDHLNLFVGVNGAGKSSVLDSMALALSWLVNRIQRVRANGSHIAESDIRNGAETSSIDIRARYGVEEAQYRWHLTKSTKEAENESASYAGVTALVEVIREYYRNTSTLPVIVSYPVSRVVNRIVPDIPQQPFSSFDTYENALGGKSNFHTFFEWFRNQDDIVNEKAGTRSRWMKQNKQWISQSVDTVFRSFEELISEDETDDKDDSMRIFKMVKKAILVEP